MDPTTVGAIIGAVVVIVVALVSATWILSDKIGDLRVDVANYHGESKERDSKVDAMWEWWSKRRSAPQNAQAMAHRAGTLT